MRIIFGFILLTLVGFVVYYSLPVTTEQNSPPVVDMSEAKEVYPSRPFFFDHNKDRGGRTYIR